MSTRRMHVRLVDGQRMPGRGMASPLLALVVVAVSPAAFACPCSEIPAPPHEKRQLDRVAGIQFMETAEYRAEFDRAVAGAKAACAEHKGEANVAVVADIDETTLSNRPEFELHPDYTPQQFREWIQQSAAKPLEPTADFLSWARQQGYAIFLITGRTENERRATIENLIKAGVAYDGLYMRANGDHRPAEDVKTEYRTRIEQQGFKIIANIGDQFSDLYGGHAIDCEKLPNRIYFIP